MTKTSIISSFIKQCNEVLNEKDIEKAKKLENTIVSVFNNEIDNITYGLDNYSGFGGSRNIDYLGDIELLKEKLKNYRADLKKTPVTMPSGPSIEINNTAHAIAHNQTSVNFTQIIKDINLLSDDELSKKDKDILEDKIISLEKAINNQNKEKTLNKIMDILEFVLDKGPKVILIVIKAISYIVDRVLSWLNN